MRATQLTRLALAAATLTAFICTESRVEAQAKKKKQQNPAYAPVVDQPGLPKVLLLGDSISIGYTPAVQSLLKGKANVHRPAANCQSTKQGLELLDGWLGDGKWDVVHFNWGLHDLKYVGPDGRTLADPKTAGSTQQVPLDQYAKNLDALVVRLKQRGAKLIWCSTTPVPEGSTGRVAGDQSKYNAAALEVMQRHNVAVDDLCAFADARLKEIQRPANVHFTPEGSEQLAAQVAKSIEAALGSNR